MGISEEVFGRLGFSNLLFLILICFILIENSTGLDLGGNEPLEMVVKDSENQHAFSSWSQGYI